LCIDQLHRHPNTIPGVPHAAFQEGRYLKLAADFAGVHGPVLEDDLTLMKSLHCIVGRQRAPSEVVCWLRRNAASQWIDEPRR
jgi:hypothetical protein